MRIATLTPTLGDRPKFVDFCKKRILNQTIQPDIMLFVDYKNTNGKVDIAKRYKRGIESLLSRGIDLIGTDYVICMDSDAELIDPTLLPEMRAILTNEKNYGCG
nr:hypothetical protein [Bacteroidales bacterium]